MQRELILLRIGILLTLAPISHAGAPTFQQLMDPACLPHPQRGMEVESADVQGSRIVTRTTGATFTFDTTTQQGVFEQRIAAQRTVARIRVDGGSGEAKLTQHTSGLALIQLGGALDCRINGDSLFMFHARTPLTIRVEAGFPFGFQASYENHHLLLDELGGFGIYCSPEVVETGFTPYGTPVTTYQLPADAVLWIAVCPPKPYDWRRSQSDHVLWLWSRESAYPSNDEIASLKKHGNILLLQSEVMLWKDWNLGFEPRLGAAEFARVRETCHRHGMRFIVYTSPFYFLRGTPLESKAMNSFQDFKGWPPGTATGENIHLFLPEIERLLRTHKPDGLYFDGQYTTNPAALYLLARRTRELLGEDGLLEWHSTDALGPDQCYLPQADAYVDFILRGEGREASYSDARYLRYFVSGYNASNSIGVLCNNGTPADAALMDRLIAVNARMHSLGSWLNNQPLMEVFQKHYLDRLNPNLRSEVERLARQRQAEIPSQFTAIKRETDLLAAPPKWTRLLLDDRFETLDGWERHESLLSSDALRPAPEGLSINARASTYAFAQRPLGKPIQGFVAKLRQGTDRGQAWGPCIALRWTRGGFLRVGLRSDGNLQITTIGVPRAGAKIEDRLVAHHDASAWNWIRARWGEHLAVIECSQDGQKFVPIHQFDHGGVFGPPATELLVGKVPYHGATEDYTVDPGPSGVSQIAKVQVYAP